MSAVVPSAERQGADICSPLALAKAKIVAPLRGLRPIPPDLLYKACQEAGVLMGKGHGEVSHQTIRNWLETLETAGPAGLDRKMRRDRGKSTLSPEIERLIKGILLCRKRFSIEETRRRVERYARSFLKLPEDKIPTRKQIIYVWSRITEEEKILAYEGMHAYRRKFDQHVRFEALHANAVWQADHHQLDIIVVDPETREELGRPWITKIQDDYSRAVVGFFISMNHPGSIEIAFALYHAFLSKPQSWWIMHGYPQILYVDNGKDWISHHIEGVCLSFGIELRPHEPYHPQSKGKIERWFRTLEEMCLHPLDGSVGSNLQARPHKIAPRLTLEQVRIKIERFIKEYHERKHGTTKQRPIDRWLEDTTLIREVTDLSRIDQLLKNKTYKVQRDGIHFNYGRYLDRELQLSGYIGKKVTIFFNPDDYSKLRVWGNDESGNFCYICTAYPQIGTGVAFDQEAIDKKNKERRELVRQRVREANQDAKEALRLLDGEERERDIAAQEVDTQHSEQEGSAPSQTSAEGLLKTSRPASQPARLTKVPEIDTNADALRRQLIRSRR